MPELGYKPVNRYLPPRKAQIPTAPRERVADGGNKLLKLLDKVLSR